MTKMSPYLTVKLCPPEDFWSTYDPATTPHEQDRDGGTALVAACDHKDPNVRLAMANRLLDDGADPTAYTRAERLNTPHLLLTPSNSPPAENVPAEAALLNRLLDGGADINLRSPRWGTPLQALKDIKLADEEMVPYYDVIFERPNLRFDLKLARSKTNPLSDIMRGVAPRLPLLNARFEAYILEHPESMPHENPTT